MKAEKFEIAQDLFYMPPISEGSEFVLRTSEGCKKLDTRKILRR